jgi:hypothetical protein
MTTTTDPITQPTATDTVRTYLEAYGEPDGNRRAALIARAWSPNGELIDPPFDGAGHEAISALAAAAQAHYPGHTFRLASGVDLQHRFGRYLWELVDGSGTTMLSGTDFVEFDTDGTLRRVVGFFGPLDITVEHAERNEV